MMNSQNKLIFAMPGNEHLAQSISKKIKAPMGAFKLHKFPDQETLIQLSSDVKDKEVIMICTLNHPDEKLLPLYFFLETVYDLGAKNTCLIAPYLAYMRQDKRFHDGESITSSYFAKLISKFTDAMITVDPHLHRRTSLSEIYSIPTVTVHAADRISAWIKEHIKSPVLIGPDSESEQWVAKVASQANAPFIVLNKTRHGDRDVKVSVPEVEKYQHHTPVLVDDIISTAHTMIETVHHLKKAAMQPPVCIGIHAIFAENAYEKLKTAGVQQIVSCNTIKHETNEIDLSGILVKGYEDLCNQHH